MKRAAILVLGLALAASGCSNSDNSTPPTAPTIPRTTDNLSGTVQVKGNDFKPFTVTATGQVDVTLTTAGPPSNVVVGVGIGTTGSGSCVLLSGASASLAAGGALPTGIMTPGTYCVQVFDAGSLTGPINWTATVTHP